MKIIALISASSFWTDRLPGEDLLPDHRYPFTPSAGMDPGRIRSIPVQFDVTLLNKRCVHFSENKHIKMRKILPISIVQNMEKLNKRGRKRKTDTRRLKP